MDARDQLEAEHLEPMVYIISNYINTVNQYMISEKEV